MCYEVNVMWRSLTMWHGRPACSHVCCRSYRLQWLLYSLCPGPHRYNTSKHMHTHTVKKQYYILIPDRSILLDNYIVHVFFCNVKMHRQSCYLIVALMWYRLKYYGLHSWYICKFHLRYVKSTNHMGPAWKDTKEQSFSAYTHKRDHSPRIWHSTGVCGDTSQ